MLLINLLLKLFVVFPFKMGIVALILNTLFGLFLLKSTLAKDTAQHASISSITNPIRCSDPVFFPNETPSKT